MFGLTRWDPFAEATSLHDAVNRLFETAVVRPSFGFTSFGAGCPTNVYDKGDDLIVEAYLPGVSQEDIQVSIDRGVLTITGKRQAGAREADGQVWYAQEFGPAEFQRSLSLPYTIDADHCQAHFDSGVLTLTLPKAEAAKPKRIPTEAGAAQPQLTAGVVS